MSMGLMPEIKEQIQIDIERGPYVGVSLSPPKPQTLFRHCQVTFIPITQTFSPRRLLALAEH